MATQAPPPNSAFLAPRYWSTWIGIALLCLIAWLPFRLRMGIGAVVGKATWLLGKERRYITGVNIRLCFPELSQAEQADLVYQAFINSGIGLIETATGWVRPREHFSAMTVFQGEEVLTAAMAKGKGVLLLGAHYSTLDFGANLMSLHYPFAVTYRAHKNPLFDAFMLRGRISNCNGVFDRKDIRGAFRHLKQGKILWYAPDQDYGPDQAVYAPFFGQTAATITASSRFAAINHSPVVMVGQRRLSKQQRYIIEYSAFPAGFPSGNDEIDATLVNRMIEEQIRKAPAQYLWMHKRFKTQAGGKPDSPYIFIKTPQRKLTESMYEQLTAGARPAPEHVAQLQLADGLQLRTFPGLIKRFAFNMHPVMRLDFLSKLLRSQNIASVTIDNIFSRPAQNTTLVTLFLPAGTPLNAQSNIEPESIASFLAAIHHCGCSFMQLSETNILMDGQHLALSDPLVLRHLPGSAAQDFRLTDMQALLHLLQLTSDQKNSFITAYLSRCRPDDRNALTEKLAASEALTHNAGLAGKTWQ